MSFQGSPTTLKLEVPVLEVNYCYGKDYCKSKEEIQEFVRRKFISIVATSIEYNPEIYDERVLEKSSKLYFFQIDAVNPRAA